MRTTWQIGVTTFLAVLVPASIALGHGDVHERIAELNEEIEQHPSDAALYVRRGSLYALDESWAQALADYESADRIDPRLSNIDFLKARVLVELEENERAAVLLDSFLSSEPERADGYLVRARAHVALGQIDEGTDDYSRAIALFERPAPRYYLERARALIDAGRVDEALAGLREAVADLGPLASLVELAVEEEEKRGHCEEALRWADLLSPTLRHSPRWRAIAGNLAHQLGQASRAEDEYRKGLAAIDALPQARQGTEAMVAMRAQLTSRLETLAPSLSTEAASGFPTDLGGQGLALAILVALGILVVRVRK
ncbi:MAG: hypothetical protein OEM15_01150 [Myxococcales bacterium]|nr:hypothetical protein [Myxococcales bacterium]MDH3483752.1 hypothetical protein [Myxococcales bacterium]